MAASSPQPHPLHEPSVLYDSQNRGSVIPFTAANRASDDTNSSGCDGVGTTHAKSSDAPTYVMPTWTSTVPVPSSTPNTICSDDWSIGNSWLQKNPPQASASTGDSSAA